MGYIQYDLFGDSIPIEQMKKKGKSGPPTMQELHGALPDRACDRCVHCAEYVTKSGKRTRYKCGLWELLIQRSERTARHAENSCSVLIEHVRTLVRTA